MPHTLALLNDIGGGELIVIAIVGLLLFGKELPSVSRKVGKVIADFKRGMAEASTEIQREMNAAAADLEATKKDAAASVDISKEIREVDEVVRKGISRTAGHPLPPLHPPAAIAPGPPPQAGTAQLPAPSGIAQSAAASPANPPSPQTVAAGAAPVTAPVEIKNPPPAG